MSIILAYGFESGAAGCTPMYVNRMKMLCMSFYFFFFQAEDGIRDYKVTGVQTCALPIFAEVVEHLADVVDGGAGDRDVAAGDAGLGADAAGHLAGVAEQGVQERADGVEVGRGAWRGRGEISVGGGSFKKKKKGRG